MYKILVRRVMKIKAPYQLVFDTAQDWSHFSHLHHKVIISHPLLYKNTERQVFLYKARRLYPFPFFDYYVIFRQDLPDGYRNVYVNAKSGHMHTVDCKVEAQGDETWITGDHLFSLPSYWGLFPKLFPQIFLWIYRKRMDEIMDEDLEWIYERMTSEDLAPVDACAPAVPETYDIMDEFFKHEAFGKADARFEYHVSEAFDGKGRIRLKKGSNLVRTMG